MEEERGKDDFKKYKKLPDKIIYILESTLEYINEVGPRDLRGFREDLEQILIRQSPTLCSYKLSWGAPDGSRVYLRDDKFCETLTFDVIEDGVHINIFDDEGDSKLATISKKTVQSDPEMRLAIENIIKGLGTLLT